MSVRRVKEHRDPKEKLCIKFDQLNYAIKGKPCAKITFLVHYFEPFLPQTSKNCRNGGNKN